MKSQFLLTQTQSLNMNIEPIFTLGTVGRRLIIASADLYIAGGPFLRSLGGICTPTIIAGEYGASGTAVADLLQISC